MTKKQSLILLVVLNVFAASISTLYDHYARGAFDEPKDQLLITVSASMVSMSIIGAIVTVLGFVLVTKVNLTIPFSKKIPFKRLLQSFTLGTLVGVIIVGFSIYISPKMEITNDIHWPISLLSSISTSISEETIGRLFSITLLLWIIQKLIKNPVEISHKWLAIFIATLCFGVMQYIIASWSLHMTFEIFLIMVVINSLGVALFGALYLFFGLECAIIAHFATNLVLRVLAPLFS